MEIYYTYVLLCIDRKRNYQELYIGSTSNLIERLHKHRSKSVGTTKKFDDVKLIYYEGCCNKIDARKRELQLKTGFGRGYLKRRLENYLKEKANVV